MTPWLGPTGLLLAVTAILAMGFNTEDERALFLLPLGAAWLVLGIMLVIRGAPSAVAASGTSDETG